MKKNTTTWALSLLFLLTGFSVQAQKLDDFEECSKKEKIECIPFPNLYQEARAIYDQGITYDKSIISREISQTQLKKDREKIETERNDLEKKLTVAKKNQADEKKKYPASVNKYDKEVKDLEVLLKKNSEKAVDFNKRLTEGREAFKRLYNSRAALRETFDDVKAKLAYAKTHPKEYIDASSYKAATTAESEKKFKVLEQQLLTYIKAIEAEIASEEPGHKIQEDEVKKGMDALNNMDFL